MKVYYKDLAIDCPDSNVAIYVFKELFKFIYGGEPKPEDMPAVYVDPTKEKSLL